MYYKILCYKLFLECNDYIKTSLHSFILINSIRSESVIITIKSKLSKTISQTCNPNAETAKKAIASTSPTPRPLPFPMPISSPATQTRSPTLPVSSVASLSSNMTKKPRPLSSARAPSCARTTTTSRWTRTAMFKSRNGQRKLHKSTMKRASLLNNLPKKIKQNNK